MFHVKQIEQQIAEEFASLRSSLGTESCLLPQQLEAQSRERLYSYLCLLSEWTRRVDLVSSPDPQRILKEHLADSLASIILLAEKRFNDLADFSVLDIGSGAGFPGLVYSIVYPETKVVLVEPREKRCVFLSEVKRRLGLSQLRVAQSRVEELSKQAATTKAGLALIRALAPSADLLKLLRENLLREGGLVVHLASGQQLPIEACGEIIKYKLDTKLRQLNIY